MKPKKKTPQQTGRDFERWIDLSAARDCYVVPMPPIGARPIGGGALQPLPQPFDRIVVHTPTQRAICFDCKSTQDPNKCDVGDPSFVKPHQIQNLTRAGSRGVRAGLLIEATAPNQRWIYWLDWKHLDGRRPSIPWDDPKFVKVGRVGMIFDFGRLVGINTAAIAAAAPAGVPSIDKLFGDLKR